MPGAVALRCRLLPAPVTKPLMSDTEDLKAPLSSQHKGPAAFSAGPGQSGAQPSREDWDRAGNRCLASPCFSSCSPCIISVPPEAGQAGQGTKGFAPEGPRTQGIPSTSQEGQAEEVSLPMGASGRAAALPAALQLFPSSPAAGAKRISLAQSPEDPVLRLPQLPSQHLAIQAGES